MSGRLRECRLEAGVAYFRRVLFFQQIDSECLVLGLLFFVLCTLCPVPFFSACVPGHNYTCIVCDTVYTLTGCHRIKLIQRGVVSLVLLVGSKQIKDTTNKSSKFYVLRF